MLNKELLTVIDQFENAMDHAAFLHTALITYETAWTELDVKFRQFLTNDSNHAQSHYNGISENIRNVQIPNLKKFQNSKIVRGLEQIRGAAAILQNGGFSEEGKKLASAVDSFESTYDQYISTYSLADTFTLLIAAKPLKAVIEHTSRILLEVKQNLISNTQQAASGSGTIDLRFQDTQTLSSIADKLNALHVIYAEICVIVEVDPTAEPLVVGKIETGSLWVLLFGNMRVVGMMCKFFEEAAAFIYRNYTSEGRLASIT